MEFSSRMEEELRCPSCRHLVVHPVILPSCSHSLCLDCAIRLQMPQPMPLVNTTALLSAKNLNDSGVISACNSASRIALSSGLMSANGLHQMTIAEGDVDETLSVFSETDSGVVCSRPESYVGLGSQSIANLSSLYHHQHCHLAGSSSAISSSSSASNSSGTFPQVGITCPVCSKTTLTDDKGALSLPKNKTLASITNRYRETKRMSIQCQSCGGQEKQPATKMCKQCELFYCQDCLNNYHSNSKHEIMEVEDAKMFLSSKELKCFDHPDEVCSMFCLQCKVTVCDLCVQQTGHSQHQTQNLANACKSHKADLSQMLHSLSEKAKSGTEFIARLKGLQERVEMNCKEFETNVIQECDQLIEALQQHKRKLTSLIQVERSRKVQEFKDQMVHCSSRVQKTTGLLQFSIEALKETDPVSFLQMSPSLLHKVSTTDNNFVKDLEFEPRTSPEFEFHLDSSKVRNAIEAMELLEIKVPGVPTILPLESTSESNTITVVWDGQGRGGCPDGYILEIDDGNMGAFRKVFSGKETICTVEGLHFDTKYRARVKAFSAAGESDYSHCITLQTARVAWFSFDPCNLPSDVILTNSNMTVTSTSFEDRTLVGGVGFVRGVHFWEYVIDRYENNKDPAFGVARYDVAKDKMLGKDDKGWSTYIDNTRSWFVHDGQHVGRTHGGIGVGSVIGVLLDLEKHTLSFFLNGQRHGPPLAFTGLTGIFYPAVSLNRNVQVTLNSGLEPPVLPLSSSVPGTSTLSAQCNFHHRLDGDRSMMT